MSTKALFKTLYPFALLAVTLLVAQVVNSQSAIAPALENSIDNRSPVGSDWIERHPAAVNTNYYAGSDYMERLPARLKNNTAGSDWIERHPTALTAMDYMAGSDWIERHPTVVVDTYAGSDFFERHPSNFETNSDRLERHPGCVC